jgi:RNA recognition motif-containing protein
VKARAKSNGFEMDGCALQVEFSGDKPRPGGPTSGAAGESNTIFCGNLGFRTTEDAIYNFFGSIGTVTTVRVALNEEQRPKGFAHIEFETPADAAKAVE